MKIENQIALVTGSNRGIGRAIVDALVERGVSKIYAAARNISSLDPLVQEHGSKIVPLELDVTSESQIAEAAEKASDATVIINNAGYLDPQDLITGDLAAARREFEINYWGPLGITRTFTPVFKANGGGTFINLSSIAGLSNYPSLPTYSDSKAAVHSLTSGARLLLSGEGINVIGVYPGPVDTDLSKDFEMEKATPASVANAILDGFESGASEVFPDPMSEGYRGPYEAGQKTIENNIAQMLQSA